MAKQWTQFFIDNEQIVLRSDGRWFSDETEITHEGTIGLFFRSLKKMGLKYVLEVGPESKEVRVEDTPAFVQRIEGSASKGYLLYLLGGAAEPLRAETLTFRPGRLTAVLSNGYEAKFLRQPFYEILRDVDRDGQGFFIRVSGKKIGLECSDVKDDEQLC